MPYLTPPRPIPSSPPRPREDILADEFTRPVPPGLRPFSVGLLRLARNLGLQIALPIEERHILTECEEEEEEHALCYLFDETTDLSVVTNGAITSDFLRDYSFTIRPALLVAVRKEIQQTLEAIGTGDYHVAPKPSDAPDPHAPAPPGKSLSPAG